MDNYTVAHDIEPPLPHALAPEDAPAREPGIPHLDYRVRDYSEPGPSTEIGRAQRMDAVARNIPKAQMLLAGIAGAGVLAAAIGAVFLLRPRRPVVAA